MGEGESTGRGYPGEATRPPPAGGGSRRAIVLGFAVVIALMVAMTALGVNHMASIHNRLEVIVHHHNLKTELLGNMRNAARERSVTLLRLAITTDPFDIEDGIVYFRQMASDFMVNRGRLVELGLGEQEQILLDESRELSRIAVEVQQRVLDDILAGDLDAAADGLLNEAIPAQNLVLAHVDAMLELQREAGLRAVEETSAQYQAAVAFMFLLGGGALMMGVLVARTVARRTTRIESDLFREKERAQVTLHAIGDAVITTDTRGLVEYLNPVAEHLTGWPAALARGRSLAEVFRIVREGTGEPLTHHLVHGLPDGTASSLNQGAILISRDGRESAIEEVSAPIRDRTGQAIGAALVFRDVTKAREMARRLSWAATHDSLTGLVNRSEFERRLDLLVTTAHQEGRQHAILYLDLDQFKVVNDTCGHGAGDDLLRQLSQRLQAPLRENDTLARLGGDEFGVLLEGCPLERAREIAESLRGAVSDFRFRWQEKVFTVGASIGVAAITEAQTTAAGIMSDADAACYLAKEQGRNRIHVIRAGDDELARRQGEMNWVQRINQALEEDRLVLYQQQIVPVNSGGETHTEILVRMIGEGGAIIPPNAFIPAAERYGLMPAIDRWVVSGVLRYLRTPHAERFARYAINLSGQSVCDRALLDFIVGALEESGVEPSRVCFEITETAAVANIDSASRFISVLSGMGCRFALDDFGTGMSSFGYLRQLKVDYLKIDGSFVRDMAEDRINRAMVESIDHIGHIMGIETVAECVADAKLLDHLRVIGVDYAQGFGLHLPEPLEAEGDKARVTAVKPLKVKG
ncbi:diguanylate cyclase [Thioalkalivibrio denitrificans]|uniref:Diguanylate cyclase n=1 Tax=Thioalkalivibrio denitrificans TaxID=108003 RepID=A0A1V3NJX4_9GAMM|nr:EAL domain-containing protein [Thioalkalivibrio denitrificans]OOG25056.1 diguanylate cyclase [Thioalkalivibrio denitrificans]